MIEYSNTQIASIIDEYIHNDLYRKILKSRYIDGLTYEAIAELYDRSVRNIKNIVKKYEIVVFKKLELAHNQKI